MTVLITMPKNYDNIRTGIVELLRAARSAAARNVNSIMTATYWEIGRRIVTLEQGGERRAEYGEQLIEQLAGDLTRQFGRGFGRANLRQMRAFYCAWPDPQIRQTPSGEFASPTDFNEIGVVSSTNSILAARFPLPWSAYVRLLSVKRPEARSFYETQALRLGWSIRQLNRQISSQFYERIALSKNKAAILETAKIAESGDWMTPEEAIKDPFVLEFLDLKDEYSESDLEAALIQHLTDFLLELGDDFAFRCSISLSRLSSFSRCRASALLFDAMSCCCAAISASSAARSSVFRSAMRASAIARSMPQICNSDRSKSCNLSCRLWFPRSLWLTPINAL
jgi:predicted nuclease of restriction endonuclease-like (RecB) superfamily